MANGDFDLETRLHVPIGEYIEWREQTASGVYILHEKERNLIKFIRELQFGEVTIKVQDGIPMLIEKATEKIKL